MLAVGFFLADLDFFPMMMLLRGDLLLDCFLGVLSYHAMYVADASWMVEFVVVGCGWIMDCEL